MLSRLTALAALLAATTTTVGAEYSVHSTTRGRNITFNNCYDQNCSTTFTTAHLDPHLPCSGGCYVDKSNKTFCDSASNFRCFPDRVEYTQHVGVENCSARALLTVNTSVHIVCTEAKNHQGVIYNRLVNYSGSC